MNKLLPMAALALAACSNDFDPVSRVTTTRILAVTADRPYAAPGEEVQLAALGHDPFGRPITWAWGTCVNPKSSTPAGCFAEIAQRGPAAFATGVGQTTFTVRVPDDALTSLPASARASAMIGVGVVACPGTLSFEAHGPRCTDASGRAIALEEFDVGVKRIFVRARDRNQNPAIAQITWDGAPWPEGEIKEIRACNVNTNTWDDCDVDKHRVHIGTTSASFESGVDEHGLPYAEELLAQYYGTEGIFEFPMRRADSAETGFVARKAGQIELWFVVRDNRGGATWTSRTVRAR